MVRIGILGAARVAEYALIAAAKKRDDVDIVAVASRDFDKARAYADKHEIAEALDNYDALIYRNDIDLVYNALPPSRHADLSIAALQVGKHVLCEKPFCMDATEAKNMVEAAEQSGRHLMEAFHYRFHPAFARLIDIVNSGSLGAIKQMEGIFCVEIPHTKNELRYDPKLGGGAVMDLGCYPIHMMRTLTGEEAVVTKAQVEHSDSGVDIAVDAMLAFPSGITGRVRCAMGPRTQLAVGLNLECTKGSIEFDNPIAAHIGHQIRISKDGETKSETVDGDQSYDHQLDHVLKVIAGDAEPVTGGRDAVHNMQTIGAVLAF